MRNVFINLFIQYGRIKKKIEIPDRKGLYSKESDLGDFVAECEKNGWIDENRRQDKSRTQGLLKKVKHTYLQIITLLYRRAETDYINAKNQKHELSKNQTQGNTKLNQLRAKYGRH